MKVNVINQVQYVLCLVEKNFSEWQQNITQNNIVFFFKKLPFKNNLLKTNNLTLFFLEVQYFQDPFSYK